MNKSTEMSVVEAKKKDEASWSDYRGLSIIIPELMLSFATICNQKVINISAGVWHDLNSLNRLLWRYYGTGMDYTDRALRSFGRNRALGGLLVGIILEGLASICIVRYLERAHPELDKNKAPAYMTAAGFMTLRVLAYIAVTLFSQENYLRDALYWGGYRRAYLRYAIDSWVWGTFWLVLAAVALLVLHVLVSCRKHARLAVLIVTSVISLSGYVIYAAGGIEGIQWLVWDLIDAIMGMAHVL